MRVSRSEFEACVRKAARGAGWPPSLAEDLSRAAGAFAATGGSGGDMALRMVEGDLRQTLANIIAAFEMALSSEEATISGAPDDLLAACALSLGAEHRCGFDLSDAGDAVRISVAASKPIEIVEIFVLEDVWQRLQALAHKSYVPASEASRLAGAGAGLTDND